jgi:ATP-dependent DNA ligase
MIAWHDGERVRLLSRRGLDWGDRFQMIVAAVEALSVRSCIIDGEVIACGDNGLSDFELLRYRRRDAAVTLVGFDLIELDGHDLRREPIEHRKAELAQLLAGCRPGIVLNAVFDDPGPTVFEHACRLGCEGIVSKRRGSRYAAGLVLNAVFDDPGPTVFEHACRLGCEGIVSKRRGSRYAAGRSDLWIKVKNPAAPAALREAEEDWGRSDDPP